MSNSIISVNAVILTEDFQTFQSWNKTVHKSGNSKFHFACYIIYLSRARAHNRLESRYSNSSGGSYEDEKSESIWFSREWKYKLAALVQCVLAHTAHRDSHSCLSFGKSSKTRILSVSPWCSAFNPKTLVLIVTNPQPRHVCADWQ